MGDWIFGREYTDGTLKNIFAIPVTRGAFLAGKLFFFALLSLAFMAFTWLELLLAALVCACFFPAESLAISNALFFLIWMLFGGVLLFAAQTPLVWLAIQTRGMPRRLFPRAMRKISMLA